MSTAAYGEWPSPLSPQVLAGARISFSGLQVGEDGSWWWAEGRPAEGGRQVVVRRRPGAEPQDASPPGLSVRTRVHEYGGSAFAVAGDTLIFVSLEDQALWSVAPGHDPVRLSQQAPDGESYRHGDPVSVPGRPWVVCVREVHHGGTPGVVDDQIVAVETDGSGREALLASGHDFYAAPRPGPDGDRLAWLYWDHPNMSWDGCRLVVAGLDFSGPVPAIGPAAAVAGGDDESVGQPVWGPDGRLFFVSDRHGWWQPFCLERGAVEAKRLADEEADFHGPDWVLGQSTLVPLADGRLVCRVRREGTDAVVVVDGAARGPGGVAAEVVQPCVSISAVRAAAGGKALALIGATPDEPAAVRMVSLPPAPSVAVVHRPADTVLDASWVSRPRLILTSPTAIPTLFFGPRAPNLAGPDGTAPPLVVVCHGGPTASAEAGLDLSVQQWTSRGVAVAVVDYRGSSGHGRAYRRALDGGWGLFDAEDCTAAARALADMGLVDGTRMVVKGSSAGGLTALRCLAPGGPFAGAVVAYGVTDLRSLAADTHKFESRYLDRLVGPWPEAAATYEDRSPALHPERITGAVLLLQGSDDPVVPLDQAQRLAAALRGQGLRCDLEVFAGEGHGFRRADTLARAAQLELAFVGSVLGFTPAP